MIFKSFGFNEGKYHADEEDKRKLKEKGFIR